MKTRVLWPVLCFATLPLLVLPYRALAGSVAPPAPTVSVHEKTGAQANQPAPPAPEAGAGRTYQADKEPPRPTDGSVPDVRWFEGTLSYRGDTMPLRVKIRATPARVDAWLDLPELVYAWEPLPASGVLNALSIELPFGVGTFVIDSEQDDQTVRRKLGEHEMVLKLTRTGEPGFVTHPVRFANGDLRLAGTVLLPPGPGPHPAVVLTHGAGPKGRETWSYRSWADFYLREGFAVLVYDKRGVGESDDADWDADLDVLAADLDAALATLRGIPQVDTSRIGIHGGSQGAWLATLVAGHNETVSFLVLTSAAATDPLTQKLIRVQHELRAAGFTDDDIAAALSYMDLYERVVRTGSGWPELKEASARASDQPWGEYVFQPTEEAHLRWYRNNHTVDPVPVWRELDIPVLAFYGAADSIVPPSAHAEGLQQALGDNAQVQVFPNADHRLETPLGEDADGTWRWFRIAPGLLDSLREWLERQVL